MSRGERDVFNIGCLKTALLICVSFFLLVGLVRILAHFVL